MVSTVVITIKTRGRLNMNVSRCNITDRNVLENSRNLLGREGTKTLPLNVGNT